MDVVSLLQPPRLALLLSIGFAAATTATTTTATAAEIEFQRDILPILEENCLFCHGEDEQESNLRLDRRVGMLRGGDSGLRALVPGEPKKSYLLEVINHADPGIEMPPDEDKLPAEQIALLTRWIEAGAEWPGQMDEVAEGIQSDHWAFQPVQRPEVPAAAEHTNPVDAFLASKLQQHDLSFSPVADPRTLIRRASIVLTGLAPTAEEVADFATAYAAEPTAAYHGLVDRLLASPHFGERWAQHWLDVIRWAETNGSEANLYRKNAWVYRDYVVRSFNEDKPYNQFVAEQLAGDSLGSGEATGFLVAGPHVPAATVGQVPTAIRQARADRMDEIMQTVGASMMGLTIGCARCHNHKFDPLSIQDYYSLTAVFQDIEFGGRFPELSREHPRRQRGEALWRELNTQRNVLRKTGPWQEDWGGYRELHFPKQRTAAVRISFKSNYVRLDELEIFGPADNKENLALASSGATVTENPAAWPNGRAPLANVNDGNFGTQGWSSSANKEKQEQPWIEVRFPTEQDVNRLRLSTNREYYFETDYLTIESRLSFSNYRLEVEAADGTWQQIATIKDIEKRDKQPERKQAIAEVQRCVTALLEEGPRPSFIGRLIKPVTTHVFHRGSPENPRDEVMPAGPAVLAGDLGLTSASRGRARRAEFAQWLTEPTHPLTARVMVNRLWHHVFGTGIVPTTADFGTAGALPTHPELLDWLAAEFVEPTSSRTEPNGNPWSVKAMLRLLVTSTAFRQASHPTDAGLAADAGALLLWRFPPRRVEAEVIRDNILLATGSLDRTLGGRSFRIHNEKKTYAQWQVVDNHGPDTWRRMLYQERMRRVDDRMFTAFDFPDCGQIRAKRPISTTPLQALNLMNSPFVVQQAERLVARVSAELSPDASAADKVRRCFQLLLNREPDAEELTACVEVAEQVGLPLVCRTLINSNEFAFLP